MVLSSIEKWMAALGKLIIIILVVLLTLNSFLRYFLGSPITGIYAISSELLMIMMVYLSLSFVYNRGGFIRMDILSEQLSKNQLIKNILEAIFDILGIITWSLFMYTYYLSILFLLKRGPVISLGFNIPKIYPSIIIFIGVLIITLSLTVDLFQRISRIKGGK